MANSRFQIPDTECGRRNRASGLCPLESALCPLESGICHLESESGRPTARARSDDDEAVRVGPLAQLFLELLALIDDDLPVVGERHLEPLQRPGGGPFEVDAGDVEAAAVARAFELLL